MFQTRTINGLHYSYYPEDEGNIGISAICDETDERVILELDSGHFTGRVIREEVPTP